MMTRSMKTLWAALVCAVIAAGSAQAAALTAAQKEEIGPVIRDYILKNPGVIVEALEAYQKQEQAKEKERFKENIVAKKADIYTASTPFAGNEKGDTVIVEFFDYNCGYCHRAVDDVTKIIEEDKNVKVLFKDLPILSESSVEASRWALAAQKQGKYLEYHVALMKHQGQKTADELARLAKDVGLDVEKARKDAAEDKGIRTQLEQNMALARDLGVNGTPAFIIGDHLAPGYMGYDGLKSAVADARKGGKKD